jgi:acyl-CoA synthetase (AMP-forming)/AMP-acid ligase II
MNNIGNLLTQRARLNPNAEAFVDGQTRERLSFRDLDRRANRAANLFLAQGFVAGERIALMARNSAEFVEIYFALAKIGVVCVPLNWRLAAEELQFIVEDSGSVGLVYAADFKETATRLKGANHKGGVRVWFEIAPSGTETVSVPESDVLDYVSLRDAARESEPPLANGGEDILFIMYTSGTTGNPKGVIHSHESCFWAVLTFAATHDLRPGDRYLAALPMFHVGALTPIAVNVYTGATSVVMREFDPDLAWELIEKERVTTALLVPAILNFMLHVQKEKSTNYSSLRWIQAGAAPVPVRLIKAYEALGIEIDQIYGLTESGGPACLIDAENALRKVGSTGKAFFHTEVKIAREDGSRCQPGEHGEVWIRGRHIMKGYWNQPESTREALQDGWLRTGDGAMEDEDGYIYMQDRIKDMIISGGENIYPAEIENILAGHPEIVEVAVIGQPSDTWGESPFAVVVPKSGRLSAADVIAHCDGKLARYKRICGVGFVDSLPRNPSGKILKRVLREQFPGPAPL